MAVTTLNINIPIPPLSGADLASLQNDVINYAQQRAVSMSKDGKKDLSKLLRWGGFYKTELSDKQLLNEYLTEKYGI